VAFTGLDTRNDGRLPQHVTSLVGAKKCDLEVVAGGDEVVAGCFEWEKTTQKRSHFQKSASLAYASSEQQKRRLVTGDWRRPNSSLNHDELTQA